MIAAEQGGFFVFGGVACTTPYMYIDPTLGTLFYYDITAPATTYASGGYDVLVRNQTSGRFEKTTI